MLKNKLIRFKFLKFLQAGMYIDFIFKKFFEVFLRNIVIYSSLFFGEKYVIEVFTKKLIDSLIFNTNKFNIFNYNESKYFIQIILVINILVFILVYMAIII